MWVLLHNDREIFRNPWKHAVACFLGVCAAEEQERLERIENRKHKKNRQPVEAWRNYEIKLIEDS